MTQRVKANILPFIKVDHWIAGVGWGLEDRKPTSNHVKRERVGCHLGWLSRTQQLAV